MSTDNRLYQIALSKISGVGDITGRLLLQTIGDEKQIFKSSKKDLMTIKGINQKTIQAILDPNVLLLAEKELQFIENNAIKTYFIGQKDYPKRLRECADAPLIFYWKGNANIDTTHIISIVGTRNATNYGISFCENFLKELSASLPDALIVSGLAYGIDIAAHRAALKNNLPTVAVLAHGLDRVYPALHQQTAKEMIDHGGLLTEFGVGTEPDKHNFVRRNRIVAGIADAVIIVESNEKGGSIITAELANSYSKDVFGVPGRLTDGKSDGCNKLIANNRAGLFLSTTHFLEQMSWDNASQKKKNQPRQQSLFFDLSADETTIINSLRLIGSSSHLDELSIKTSIPVFQLLSLLFEMEMKGFIENLPGNRYALKME